MAHCEQGYLCDVCGEEVESLTESDLYLHYVIGEVSPRELLTRRERHIRCNPVEAQFIVCPEFAAVIVEGAFSKSQMSVESVRAREELLTRGWKRLQELPGMGLSIAEYRLPEIREPGAKAHAPG